MKTLIVEDDFTSRLLMQELLKPFGAAHIAVNGREAVEAVRTGMDSGEPYDLVCLDVMMPEMDGYQALKQIREMEEAPERMGSPRARVIMTTALNSRKNILDGFRGQCDAYLIKPIDRSKLVDQLHDLGLLGD